MDIEFCRGYSQLIIKIFCMTLVLAPPGFSENQPLLPANVDGTSYSETSQVNSLTLADKAVSQKAEELNFFSSALRSLRIQGSKVGLPLIMGTMTLVLPALHSGVLAQETGKIPEANNPTNTTNAHPKPPKGKSPLEKPGFKEEDPLDRKTIDHNCYFGLVFRTAKPTHSVEHYTVYRDTLKYTIVSSIDYSREDIGLIVDEYSKELELKGSLSAEMTSDLKWKILLFAAKLKLDANYTKKHHESILESLKQSVNQVVTIYQVKVTGYVSITPMWEIIELEDYIPLPGRQCSSPEITDKVPKSYIWPKKEHRYPSTFEAVGNYTIYDARGPSVKPKGRKAALEEAKAKADKAIRNQGFLPEIKYSGPPIKVDPRYNY